MPDNLLIFPQARTRKFKQKQIDEALAADPNFRFIRDLLVAIEGVGLDLETSPEAKARELYARYQQQNVFAQCFNEVKSGSESES